jgi:hypothetical protein
MSKKAKPHVLADRLEDLHQIGVSLDESSTALAAFEAIDIPGKAMCQGWIVELQELFAEYDKIKKLVPEATWRMYDMMGTRGLREQKLLDDSKKKIRKHWKNRPGPIK